MKKQDLQKLNLSYINSSYETVEEFLSKEYPQVVFSDETKKLLHDSKILVDKIKGEQQTESSHYVQEAHLSKFGIPSGKYIGRLYCADVKAQKVLSKTQSPSRVCCDSYYYSLITGVPDIIGQLVEKILGSYENKFSNIYENLHSLILTQQPLNTDQIYSICEYVALSYLRSETYRNQLQYDSSEFVKLEMKAKFNHLKLNLPEDQKMREILTDKNFEHIIQTSDYDVKTDNAEHIRMMSNPDEIEKLLKRFLVKKMKFYISDGEKNFIVTSSCVEEICQEPKSVYGTHFCERYHYFALSPKILVEFSDPIEYGKHAETEIIGKERVTFFNLIRSMYCDYMYAPSKNDLIANDYVKAYRDNVDLIGERFPSDHGINLQSMDEMRFFAKSHGMKYESNFDLMTRLSKISYKTQI